MVRVIQNQIHLPKDVAIKQYRAKWGQLFIDLVSTAHHLNGYNSIKQRGHIVNQTINLLSSNES